MGALRRLVGGRQDVEELIARANSCLARTRRLTDGIFSFARAGALPEPNAHARISPIVDDLVRDARVRIDGEPPIFNIDVPASFEVCCSVGVLTSVLSNLFENALKYTKDSPLRRIVIRARVSDDRVRVEVEDNGPGVPEGLEGRVFEPYVRAAGATQPGLGLGLATVKRLCEGHGGAVGVTSEIGHGSHFWFELPRWVDGGERTALSPQPA
jgi:signal transduction histidine kinase